MLKLIETFSGIGSQVQAMKNSNIEHKVVATVEWEIGAIYAYDIMHNGKQDLRAYRHHTKESLIAILEQYNLSSDGKNVLTSRALSSMSVELLKAVLCAIDRTNNLVDIKSVKADELPEADILTYSFPCQDLSVSGHWHNQTLGIARDANNRSTLLWEIERLLIEYEASEKSLPRYLLMENVSNILSKKHIGNFREWLSFLESLGYYNQVYTLNAKDFGIPQTRVRTYLISVLVEDDIDKRQGVEEYFYLNNLTNITLPPHKCQPLEKFLRLDYSHEVYKMEALESTPSFTKSREKIFNLNRPLAFGKKVVENEYARTITTKQDRHPNSGIIKYGKDYLTEKNKYYRNLTPRECFLLMGFEEEQFDRLLKNNFVVRKNSNILSQGKLIQLAGNSIVVPVLQAIFNQISEIDESIFKKKQKVINEKVII